jgi:hypothetical protein
MNGHSFVQLLGCIAGQAERDPLIGAFALLARTNDLHGFEWLGDEP